MREWGSAGRRVLVLSWLLLAMGWFPSALNAQAQSRWEFDGFTLEVEELFATGGDLAWMPIQVMVENTGSQRVEPTVRIRTFPTDHARTIEWSTVVSSGAEASGSDTERVKVRRQILPIFIHTDESWATVVRCELEVEVDGRKVLPADESNLEFSIPRQPPSRNQSSTRGRWMHEGHFNVLVIAEAGADDPEGWRKAFREEINPTLTGNAGSTTILRNAEIEALPFRAEGYLGIDRVFIIGVEPERVSEPQREALRAAVRLGLQVWVIPTIGGKGNGWVWPKELRSTPSITVPTVDGKQMPVFLPADDPGIPRSTFPTADGDVRVRSFEYADGAGAWLRYTSPVGPWQFDDRPSENWATFALHRTLTPLYGMRRGSGSSDPLVEAIDRRYRRSIDAEALFIFVVIYLLVAGPGLFVFLRRKGRLPWLLWLQPTVVVLFLLGTGLIGWARFGVAGRTDHTFILYQKAGEPGGVLLHVRSVYSSVSAARDISPVDGESLPIPIPEAVRRTPLRWDLGPGDAELSGFRTSFWSLTHFISGQGVEMGVFDTTRTSSGISVSHDFPFDLHRLSVRRSRVAYEEQRLAPGTTRVLSSMGDSDPDAFRPIAGGELGELEAANWAGVRRQLRQWPTGISGHRASLVAEFDPKVLPESMTGEGISEARGFLVVLVEDSSR